MDRQFQMSSGVDLDDSLGFSALSVSVDNYTSQWMFLPSTQRFVQPNTIGVVVHGAGENRAQAKFQAPPGVTQPALTIGQIAVVTWSDRAGPISAGVSTVPPLVANWLIGGTTNVAVVRPDVAAAIAPATAGAFAFGAWVEAAAALDLGGHALTYLACGNPIEDFYVEVGTGAAGAEVSVGRFLVPGNLAASSPVVLPISPAVIIAANSRVAVRVAGAGAGALNIRLGFMPRPF